VAGDKNYPEALENIANPPYLFYLRGQLDNSPKIAVVGSRKMTGYGKRIIESMIPDIAKYFTIVSGGAAGVDSLSHEVTMNTGEKTVSVIGTGICQDYPVDNKKLYDKIVQTGGAVVSIFPLDEVGNPYNFPIRNETVVGLSTGIFVVEAQERSGSLITARLALESGRDVFTCPGDIFCSSSTGCNRLIKRGEAKSVFKSDHILEEYSISNTVNKRNNKIEIKDSIQQTIYDSLLLENMNLDELSRKLNLGINNVSPKVSLMEISGYISRDSDGKYSIR
ncbi:DNA-processing protein DprA, partial [Candidatus Gracilibacteria bacterium]|nr:DNA-processing protein DprA [Candidatus Gracilibacteria bacterium]